MHVTNSHSLKPSDSKLFFAATSCQPGDYQGKNMNTHALATCVFEKSEGDQLIGKLGSGVSSA